MAVQTNTFKGARYVPKFADPIEWSADNSYEAIESVQHEGFTYLSKQPVPAGVQIDNEEFWLLWADPNAQMEQLRQEVVTYAGNVEELSGVVGDLSTELGQEIEAREQADTRIENLEGNVIGLKSYNALDLGFKNDAVTDNSPILNNIITNKPINESYEIVFPVGVYAFSPIEIRTNNLILKGSGNAFSHRTRFESTVFTPMANQSYIMTLGSNTTDFTDQTQFTGNEINNIQFCTNKPNTDSRYGVDNNYKVDKALVFSRQYMSKLQDVAFYYCYGAGLEIKSSWENIFGNMFFRFVFNPEKAAFIFGTDYMSYVEGVISDCSSNIFENIELEKVCGNFITFEKDCNVENNVFNSIIVEVGRTDPSWGATWTDNTIFPSGVSEADYELAIFNFEKDALYRNNIVNSVVVSLIAARSYTWNGDVYLHNSIVKCEDKVKEFVFQIGNLNTTLNRTFVNLLNNENNDFSSLFMFSVGNAVISIYRYLINGYAEFFKSNMLNPYIVNRIYDEVNSAYNYTSEVITNNKRAPLVKGVYDCYAKNGVCAVVPDSTIFTENKTTVKIPIIGDTLHVRLYQNNADELIYIIRDFSGNQLSVGNFSTLNAGWDWGEINTSQYKNMGFVTILNRASKQENYVDVFYYD